MLHKSKIEKDNPYTLENIPSDWSFWKDLNISHIWKILLLPLILKDVVEPTVLPANIDLGELLESVLLRVEELKTPKMKADLAALAKEFYAKVHGAFHGYGDQVSFLQVIAMLNFYLGNLRDAARWTGMLGDLYFLDRHFETDAYTTHFNRIAGIAYEAGHHVAKACHHYNQYLEVTAGGIHTPQGVYDAASYCEEHKFLTITDRTLSLLHESAERARKESNDQLADNLLALAAKLENRPVTITYLTMDITEAQKNLKEVSIALVGEVPKPTPNASNTISANLFKPTPVVAKKEDHGPRVIRHPE